MANEMNHYHILTALQSKHYIWSSVYDSMTKRVLDWMIGFINTFFYNLP
jgi:hypothetical protein